MSQQPGPFDWQQQQPAGTGRAGSADVSKLRVSTGSRCGSGVRLSREFSGLDLDDSCSGGSPHRGASRGHRTQPFFIGVAGGTASGELGGCRALVCRLKHLQVGA